MKQIGLLSLVLVTGIAIGHFATSEMAVGPEKSARAQPQPPAPVPTPSPAVERKTTRAEQDPLAGLLGGRQIQDLSTDELIRITESTTHTRLGEDPLVTCRKLYEVQLLLSKLPVETLKELAQATAGNPATINTSYKAFQAWALRDWSSALEWADGMSVATHWTGLAIGILAGTDPRRAADLARQRALEGKSRSPGTEVQYASTGVAKLGQQAFFGFLDSLPTSLQSNIDPSCMDEFPPADITGIIAECSKRSSGREMFTNAFDQLLGNITIRHPERVKEWIASLEPGPQTSETAAKLARGLRDFGVPGQNVEILAAAVKQTPGEEKALIKTYLSQNSGFDQRIVPTLAKALPDGMEWTAADFESGGPFFDNGSYSGLTLRARLIARPEEQAKLVAGTINRAAAGYSRNSSGQQKINVTEFETIERNISELGLQGKDAELVSRAIKKLRKSGVAP